MLFFRMPRVRILLPSVLLLGGALAAGLALRSIKGALAAEAQGAVQRIPVVVELFTSEGCSSCPPADALLATLQRTQPVAPAEILALEEHVDYWDGLGWHDRFSSHDITERQSAYARRFGLDDNYTPQMIVDGAAQFVGNDRSQALQAITRAARTAKLAVSIQALLLNGNRITGHVGLPGSTPAGADLYAALVQPTASTQVLHGENGGHTLNHVSVVRALARIPNVRAGAPIDFSLALPKDVPAAGLRVIVFLQAKGQGPMLAAASASLPSGQIP